MADDESLFEQAMRGVASLPRRDELRARSRAPGRGVVKPAVKAAAAFEVERWGERVEAVGRGVDRGLLSALSRGEWPPQRELDLHGLTESAAQRVVASAVGAATSQGQRCLLIIHGRGLRSEAEPTLKEALIRWLTQPPLAASVLVFTTAPSSRGGAGATLVLLRKLRGG